MFCGLEVFTANSATLVSQFPAPNPHCESQAHLFGRARGKTVLIPVPVGRAHGKTVLIAVPVGVAAEAAPGRGAHGSGVSSSATLLPLVLPTGTACL